MSKRRHPRFILARLVYGAAGVLTLVLGLSAFLGIVLQTRSHALKVSVGPSRANFSKDQQV